MYFYLFCSFCSRAAISPGEFCREGLRFFHALFHGHPGIVELFAESRYDAVSERNSSRKGPRAAETESFVDNSSSNLPPRQPDGAARNRTFFTMTESGDSSIIFPAKRIRRYVAGDNDIRI